MLGCNLQHKLFHKLAGGALSSLVLMKELWNKEVNISDSEWNPLINTLQNDILKKLQDLEEKEKIENETYLPTQSQNIRDLESILTCNYNLPKSPLKI